VRFYQRADGTVLTADCPVGVRRKRVRRGVLVAAGAGALAAAAASAFSTHGKCVMGDVSMGEPVVDVRGRAVTPAIMGTAGIEPTAAPKPPPASPAPKGKKGP
jgi:hypothetical protein